MPRSASPNCRRARSIPASSSAFAATARIARSSSSAPATGPAWGCSTPSSSVTRMARRPCMSQAPTDQPYSRLSRSAAPRVSSARRRTRANAFNVVVMLTCTQRGRPPVVVMTPRSSWWQSTAERGGGIVCWFESLRALIVAPPACDVVCTANSGHELGHLGLDDFIARRPGWDRPPGEGGATWIHYGANLGAAGGELSVVSPEDDLRELAQTELALAGRPPDVLAPQSLVPSGETRDIHRAGGRP